MAMSVLSALDEFFGRVSFCPARPLLVAFSGGPDSTALLAGLAELRDRGFAPTQALFAAHLDHASDAASAERALLAERSAAALGVPWLCERREIGALSTSSESWETAARRVRYAFLEEARRATGAGWIVLGHHRDDQAETVLLRTLLGTGLYGLAAMRPIHGVRLRPLLHLPKADLRAYVLARQLAVTEDPTNHDPRSLRNRIRHRLLPELAFATATPDLEARLSRLAARAAGAAAAITHRLSARFPGLAASEPDLDRSVLRELPGELLPWALGALQRASGGARPPSRQAIAAITRRLAQPAEAGRAAVALGRGERLWIDADRLWIETASERVSRDPSESSGFTYTFSTPGRIEIPEANMVLTLYRSEFAPWMFEGEPERTGLVLPLQEGEEVEVRSRRPGDRLRPLGSPGSRTLKAVLIDRRIERARRDRLPLLCVGGRIAWIPGVTIDDRFRVRGPGDPVWIAKIEPLLNSYEVAEP